MSKGKVMYTRIFRNSMLLCLFAAPAAHAQFAVIDVSSVTQLIAQAKILQAQLIAVENQLAQARSAFASTTGGRGMEQLLSGAQRNYLPADWPSLQSAMQGSGSYGALSGGVAATISANTVLSSQQLAGLPADVRQMIDTSRQLTALQQNIAREALSTTSARFASLQQLINALPAAADQKGVLDLQARISAENSMLQNEQTKLQTLYQVVQAEERANEQRLRERAFAGFGQFSSRFQPVP
jgi:type IV secretion system protein VirB5